ncbi:Putative cytoplasmic protein [Lunatimonas lonarensis]|uniref:Putative cytoplasmic protein n=1 Tax=Lunatimonas lonarensis TaxID=1232681 RepID=R7ZML1_9BACT|nr:PDDEXK nuclease domain-containing protein [Lunatimonas lonarensis]EON75341.1 Putative cytoplasmic protein [Lunatimonas lonarensis]
MDIESSQKKLYLDICKLVEDARNYVAITSNKTLTLLYWQIGERINSNLLEGQRASYGRGIVSELATKLQEQFGSRGFQERNIRRMMQFADLFKEYSFVSEAATYLSWSHFIELLSVNDALQREFYVQMAIQDRWSTKMLRSKIDGMLFERTAISSKPQDLIKNELLNMRSGKQFSPDLVFKSPYFLDFTGLKGTYSEKSLEDNLLMFLEQFLLELGGGFSFVERQKRMIIDNEDYYLDLLFYHRKLKRLIAIELKLGRFKVAHKAQMELYLRWLEKYEMQEGENSPLGLILCAEGGHEKIELLQLEKSGIKVAEYLTELPSKELLIQKIHKELELRKNLIENKQQDDSEL